jgi:tetratricopeptide (TPR) repeat protein
MRKKLAVILILILSAVSVKIYSQNIDFSNGLKMLDDEQYQKAKFIFNSLILTDPADCKSLYYLGKTYFLRKEYDSADYCFKKIQTINPKSPYAFIGNGIISLKSNDLEGAADIFNQARKISKKDANILIAISNACLDMPKPELSLAKTYLTEIENLYPQNADYFLSKAKYDFLMGDNGKAASDLEWAYFYDPLKILAYNKLGKLYSNALLYNEAYAALSKSIEIDSNQVLVYKYLGELQYRFGKYSEAKKSYSKYLSVAEVSIEDIEKYAIILFYNKEFKAAADEMQKVMLVDPENPVMNRITAYVAYETGDYEGGMKYIKKLIDSKDTANLLAPDYLYYGKLLLKTGNDSAGIINIRNSLRLDDAKTDAYIDLAAALSKNKKHDDAIAIYEKLIVKGIDKSSTYFRMGKEYYYKGVELKENYDSTVNLVIPIEGVVNDSIKAMECYTKADSCFTIVTDLTPNFYGAYLWKGRVLSLIDSNMERGLAKEAYEKVLSMLEGGNIAQNKSSIMEAYKYLAAYYYLKSESLALTDKKASAELKSHAIELYEKIIILEPDDVQLQEILEQLKNPPKK